ncbi:MAG: hypothetical protein ACRENJ_08300, partial [Candidatus Eiseniibacteriota bacterium]
MSVTAEHPATAASAGPVPAPEPLVLAPPGDGAAADGAPDAARVALWEDLLTLVVDRESPRVGERPRRLLSHLLERVGIDEARFWELGRAQRGRLFLARYSRQSSSIPALEIGSFDIDKVLKERFRQEPLTLGAAWHHGFWRSYFSHAAITHPANDGLREEFSTAWDIVRKQPAVLFRTGEGLTQTPLRSVRIDMPMIVGPLPHTDGFRMERAWLEAIAAADPQADLHTRSLVVIEADRCITHEEVFLPHASDVVVRLSPRHCARLSENDAGAAALRSLLAGGRVAELEWSPDLAASAERVLAVNPDLLLSVGLRWGEDFWEALEAAVRLDGVAMIHYHAGGEKSYQLTPRIDSFLKSRLIRARVQLVSAGGDTDTHSSAATVYEAVLLGANGGSMTHLAGLALLPELVDVYHGAPLEPALASLEGRDPAELKKLALNTLTCWQHSILDFLSCMGIDDIQKTSGNTMAITMTEDWVREVDALATPEFGALNFELNERRLAAEPVPPAVREAFRVSTLLGHLKPDLPLVHAARSMAHESANWHLENTNRNLNADFLEVIYRMAAGHMPEVDDFFLAGDMGPLSLDGVRVRLSRASVQWSLRRLERDPALLDYISLAVPRGFHRPGAVPAGAEVTIHARAEGPALASFTADAQGGFEVRLPAGHALEPAIAGDT